VYADASLHIVRDKDFDPPKKPLEVDLDCGDEENAIASPSTDKQLKKKKKKTVIDTDEF